MDFLTQLFIEATGEDEDEGSSGEELYTLEDQRTENTTDGYSDYDISANFGLYTEKSEIPSESESSEYSDDSEITRLNNTIQLIENEKVWIHVCGPSGSGKSTLVKRLQEKLGASVFMNPNESVIELSDNKTHNLTKLVLESPEKYSFIYQIRDMCKKVSDIAFSHSDSTFNIIESSLYEQDFVWIPLAIENKALSELEIHTIREMQKHVYETIQRYGIFYGHNIYIYIQGTMECFHERLQNRKDSWNNKPDVVSIGKQKDTRINIEPLVSVIQKESLPGDLFYEARKSHRTKHLQEEEIDSHKAIPDKIHIKRQIDYFDKMFERGNKWLKGISVCYVPTDNTIAVESQEYTSNVDEIVEQIKIARTSRIEKRKNRILDEYRPERPNGTLGSDYSSDEELITHTLDSIHIRKED